MCVLFHTVHPFVLQKREYYYTDKGLVSPEVQALAKETLKLQEDNLILTAK